MVEIKGKRPANPWGLEKPLDRVSVPPERLSKCGDIARAGCAVDLHERLVRTTPPVLIGGQPCIVTAMDYGPIGEDGYGARAALAYRLVKPGHYAFAVKTIREINPTESYEGLLIYWRDEPFVMTRPVEIVGED